MDILPLEIQIMIVSYLPAKSALAFCASFRTPLYDSELLWKTLVKRDMIVLENIDPRKYYRFHYQKYQRFLDFIQEEEDEDEASGLGKIYNELGIMGLKWFFKTFDESEEDVFEKVFCTLIWKGGSAPLKKRVDEIFASFPEYDVIGNAVLFSYRFIADYGNLSFSKNSMVVNKRILLHHLPRSIKRGNISDFLKLNISYIVDVCEGPTRDDVLFGFAELYAKHKDVLFSDGKLKVPVI